MVVLVLEEDNTTCACVVVESFWRPLVKDFVKGVEPPVCGGGIVSYADGSEVGEGSEVSITLGGECDRDVAVRSWKGEGDRLVVLDGAHSESRMRHRGLLQLGLQKLGVLQVVGD